MTFDSRAFIAYWIIKQLAICFTSATLGNERESKGEEKKYVTSVVIFFLPSFPRLLLLLTSNRYPICIKQIPSSQDIHFFFLQLLPTTCNRLSCPYGVCRSDGAKWKVFFYLQLTHHPHSVPLTFTPPCRLLLTPRLFFPVVPVSYIITRRLVANLRLGNLPIALVSWQ